MTKKEFHRIIQKPKSECDGVELHLQHLYEHNSPLKLFTLTGLDFSLMMRNKEDTSGIQIQRPPLYYLNYKR